jgi:hypothetical protein
MSDPSAPLREGLKTWIRADTEVVAAFGSSQVKVFATLPTVNTAPPYVFIDGFFVEDDAADCYDGAIVDGNFHVWSLTTPPGFAQAETIAKAVKASIKRTEDTGDSPAFTLSGYRVTAVELVSTQYLTDPSDGKTVHAVIAARLSVDPV